MIVSGIGMTWNSSMMTTVKIVGLGQVTVLRSRRFRSFTQNNGSALSSSGEWLNGGGSRSSPTVASVIVVDRQKTIETFLSPLTVGAIALFSTVVRPSNEGVTAGSLAGSLWRRANRRKHTNHTSTQKIFPVKQKNPQAAEVGEEVESEKKLLTSASVASVAPL